MKFSAAKAPQNSGAPGRIRTPDPLGRSQSLYPTELQAQQKHGAGDGNRTHARSLEGSRPTIRLHPPANFGVARKALRPDVEKVRPRRASYSIARARNQRQSAASSAFRLLSFKPGSRAVAPAHHPARVDWSGRRDLNPGPPAPKAGALAKLRHAPNLA